MFMNLYLRLQFATIGRSENIGNILLSVIGWDADALTISFTSAKGDQEGERTNERKHIFASPDMPHVCVILSLAIYIWCQHCLS